MFDNNNMIIERPFTIIYSFGQFINRGWRVVLYAWTTLEYKGGTEQDRTAQDISVTS